MIRIKTISKIIILGCFVSTVFSVSILGQQAQDPNYNELFEEGRMELNRCHIPYTGLDRRYFTTQALVLDDPKAIPLLADVLKNGPIWNRNDHLARCYAAMCLGATKDPRALEPLLEALKYYDPNEEGGREFVAKYAASALALLGDTSAVEPLIETLQDPRESVKFAAMMAIVELDSSKAFEPIVAAMDRDESCVPFAIQALEMLGDLRAVEPIMKVLEENRLQWQKDIKEQNNLPEDSEDSETKRAILKDRQKKLGAKLEILRLNNSLSNITKVNFGADNPDELAELWSQWWHGGPEFTRKRFDARHKEWKAMKKKTKLEKSNARRKLSKMTDLGLPALPFMIEKIEQGETDFIPLISKLTDKELSETASRQECLRWWKANKQKWLIPFPDSN